MKVDITHAKDTEAESPLFTQMLQCQKYVEILVSKWL